MSDSGNEATEAVGLEDLPVQLSMFDPEPIVRPEHNVGKFAGIIFASPYAHNLKDEIEHSWQVKQGEYDLAASLLVSPRIGCKRPTTTTLRVFLALLQVWKHAGQPTDGVIHFSARQLAGIIGWRWAGKDTAGRIAEHVKVLSGTNITWTFSFMRPSGERDRLISDMSLIASADYAERKLLFDKERFSVAQRVRLNPDLVDNMLSGFVRPINYNAFKAISNDTALNLYTRIDLYLSKKRRWCRRSEPLFREELGLMGVRYQKRFARHAKLKQLVAEIDGVDLCHGRLNVWIEETSDKKDYKLVAVKERRKAPKNRSLLKPVAALAEAEVLADEVIGEILRCARCGQPRRAYIVYLCRMYPAELIRRAVAIAKADYQGKVKTSVTCIFVHELRELVRGSQRLTWHQDAARREEPD